MTDGAISSAPRTAARCIAGFGIAFATAGPVAAADLSVEIRNVQSDSGSVLVAVCTPDTFLRPACPYAGAAEAESGSTDVVIGGVPPGKYALQAFHDANGNSRIDRNLFGLPTEGIGFGNDAAMRFGPPAFSDAAVLVSEPVTTISMSLRYLSPR